MRACAKFLPVALLALGLVACGSEGNVFSLAPGTCFDDLEQFFDEGGGEISDVPVVDCDEQHDNEVYAAFDLEDGDFPGTEAVTAQAQDGCLEQFEDFVGTAYLDSRYEFSHLVPTRDSWAAGDREVVCFLYDGQLEKLTGSAEGTAE